MAGSEAIPPLTPEYIAQNSGYKLIIISAVFWPIILLAFGLRVYARRLRNLMWGLDDYLVIVSLILQSILHLLGISKSSKAQRGHRWSVLYGFAY
jgi:hypothetical protein